jgi:anti-sigma B factor antagonist
MTEFRVDAHDEGGVVVIDVEGRVDAFLVTKIREVINDLIQENKVRLIIRFEKVAQINSTALGILIGRLRRIRMHGGDIKIVELSPDIRRVFDVMGASRIFDIHPGVDEARTAFLAVPASTESEDPVIPVPSPGSPS